MIDSGLLILASTSGIFAFFTPCSVALIPGFVGFLVKTDDEGKILRGVKVGLVSALGLLTVFMGLGLLISLFGNFIAPFTFFIGVTAGVILIILGLYLLAGKTIGVAIPNSIGENRGVKGYFLFGATYGLASLSCTLPIFLLVMFQALSVGGAKAGILIFLIYSATAASFMALTAFAAILSKDLVRNYLGKALPVVTRLSPILIILAGMYLIYFQLRAFYL
ncbi:MAG: hypothetical protein HYT07_01275 [Candidatus Levybacteria bacterium]|nr:hypothetical protein [Candidatus Levybacteria bacterium]